MSAQAPPYYALKRTILMVICAIGIAILSYKCILIVKYIQDNNIPWNNYFWSVELVFKLILILVMICGLFGAWCQNLILTYVFAIFLLLIILFCIQSASINGIISWSVVYFFGALLALVICFLIDLHKMKRTHNVGSATQNRGEIMWALLHTTAGRQPKLTLTESF